MPDKKEVFNECYMCEARFVEILDLIDHIRTMHKDKYLEESTRPIRSDGKKRNRYDS